MPFLYNKPNKDALRNLGHYSLEIRRLMCQLVVFKDS